MNSCALPNIENSVVLDGFCAFELPVSVNKPRSLRVDTISNNIFVLERGSQSIINIFDSDGDGIPDKKKTFASADGLNHGLAIHGNFIYASSDSTVYRWPYINSNYDNNSSSTYPLDEEAAEVIVYNINEDGAGGAPLGHTTRTLEFDDKGRLYVSVGSNQNVDANSYRSRIRRLDMSVVPKDFQTMEVFADGLRNEVGLAFDRHGALWGVENSADKLNRDDLGGDIHENNPAEELNRFRQEDIGKHYGYPYCWTEYELSTGMGRGTVWAWPSSLYENGNITDEDCRNSTFIAPIVSIQGHSAPLGITFFNWISPDDRSEFCNGTESFPKEMDGYAFIAFHGSWNRDVPTGYKVVYVQMNEDGDAVGEPIDFLAHEPPNAQWDDGFRPVDLDFDDCGRLLVTSDGTGSNGSKIVRLEFRATKEMPDKLEAEGTPNQSEVEPTSSSHFSARTTLMSMQMRAMVVLFLSMLVLGGE